MKLHWTQNGRLVRELSSHSWIVKEGSIQVYNGNRRFPFIIFCTQSIFSDWTMVQYLQGCMLESTKDQKFVNTISCWLRDDFATQLAHKIRWAFFLYTKFPPGLCNYQNCGAHLKRKAKLIGQFEFLKFYPITSPFPPTNLEYSLLH